MVLAPQSKYHHQGTPRSGAGVYTCGYHVAAIPTPSVWRQQLWSAEVVHLEPLAVQTSAAPWYYSPPEQPSTDGTEYPDPLWYCHYQRSLQSRYCHYLITVLGTLGVVGTNRSTSANAGFLPCPRVLTHQPLDHRFSLSYVAQHIGEMP